MDLAQHLQAQMIASRVPWGIDEQEIEASGRTLVKTYLLEAHQSPGTNGPRGTLRQVADALQILVTDTEDPDLFRLQEGEHDFWCDTSMGRFWKLHTVAEVKSADALRDRLVSATPFLDNVWLSPSYLERFATEARAQMQTFSLSHDRRPLHREEVPSSTFDFVTLRLWASRAQESLERLRSAEVFPRGVSVRSVRLRSHAPDDPESFCVAEYFRNGKVTASGTSFNEHTRMLVTLVRDYRTQVERFELQHGIGVVPDGEGHPHLVGNPVTIAVKWTFDDVEYAVQRIFGATEPFRLWGLPERVGPSRFRAHAVDLHVGSTLTFEFGADYVTVLLPHGTCGNTVVRFLGSLLYHVDADARAGLA